jgi:hypothetical protein
MMIRARDRNIMHCFLYQLVLESIKGWICSIKCMIYVCVVLAKHHIFGKESFPLFQNKSYVWT